MRDSERNRETDNMGRQQRTDRHTKKQRDRQTHTHIKRKRETETE